MKLTSSMKLLLAAAVAAVLATSAKASNVPTYANGDLLLGFYDFSGTVQNDYLVDLGPVTSLTSSQTLSLGLNTDLTHVFGSDWFTSGNIYFGLAAAYPLTGQVYASNPNDGTPWTESPAQGSMAEAVVGIGQQYSHATQNNGETYSAGLEQSNGATNSWESVAAGGNGLGGFFGSGGDGQISDVVSNAIELDQVNSGPNGTPSTDVGSVSINSAGNLTVTAAVPEPSTFAALGLGAAVLAFAGRRKLSRQ